MNYLKSVVVLIIGMFLLLSPALYNGYPLVYSDTGTYIFSGMEFTIPLDRPIAYGLFIRYASLNGLSLWPVVMVQSIIGAYLLYQIVRLFAFRHVRLIYLMVVAFLAYFTSIGWYSSQLMPDIFTAYVILSGFLLLYHPPSLTHKIALSIIMVIGLSVHFSNLALFILLLIFVGLTLIPKLKLPTVPRINLLLPSLLVVISFFGLKLINYSIDQNSSVNRSSHVFLMGKLLDTGILEQYLCEKCSVQPTLPLCEFKENLPSTSRELLWDNNSPLQHYGGWTASKEPFNQVIFSVMTSPKFLAKFLLNITQSTLTQLFQNDIGSGLISDWYAAPDSPPAYAISTHFSNEYTMYQQSRQNGNLWGQRLDFDTKNNWNGWLFFISVMGIAAFWRLVRKLPNYASEKSMLVFMVAGIVINALVTAGLANIYDRLQARVSWLFIFLFLLACTPYLVNKIVNYMRKERV